MGKTDKVTQQTLQKAIGGVGTASDVFLVSWTCLAVDRMRQEVTKYEEGRGTGCEKR